MKISLEESYQMMYNFGSTFLKSSWNKKRSDSLLFSNCLFKCAFHKTYFEKWAWTIVIFKRGGGLILTSWMNEIYFVFSFYWSCIMKFFSRGLRTRSSQGCLKMSLELLRARGVKCVGKYGKCLSHLLITLINITQ